MSKRHAGLKRIGKLLKEIGWDEKLKQLAGRIDRNVPHYGNPERFHEEKSEIKSELMRMSEGRELT
jgi:hypothetical protein